MRETYFMRLIRLLAGALVATMLLASSAAAGDWEDAEAAYERRDFATAFQLWKPLADQGDADAQFNLGVMCSNGRGVPEDYTEAAKWFRKAADRGNDKAQFNLALMFHEGTGVPQDYIYAYMWYTLARLERPQDG